MAIEVFNRYEHKYMMDDETYHKVSERLQEHMVMDYYNFDSKPYTISNVYYDTADNHLIRTSLMKPKYKEKFRMRAYGVPKEGDQVFLEIKKKYTGLVNKRRSTFHLEEAYQFCESGRKPECAAYMNPQVLNELAYLINHYQLRPAVYIAYERVAYFEQDNPDLRISFDTNVRARRHDLRLEAGDMGTMLLPEDVWLMEIKVGRNMPYWLTKILSEYQLKSTSFSKYGTEFKRYIGRGKKEAVWPVGEREAIPQTGAKVGIAAAALAANH